MPKLLNYSVVEANRIYTVRHLTLSILVTVLSIQNNANKVRIFCGGPKKFWTQPPWNCLLQAALYTLELEEMTKATSTASQVIISTDKSLPVSNFLFDSPPDCMSREPFWVTREDAVILTTTLLC